MREFGLVRTPVTSSAASNRAGAGRRTPLLVGGDYTRPTNRRRPQITRRCRAPQAAGVEFRLATAIERIAPGGRQIAGVVASGENGPELLTADAYVVALGSWSPRLLRPLGVGLPVYPAKGYSATLTLADGSPAPTVSLTDDERKLVFSRLGNRLRIAGTAEFTGHDLDLNPVRCAALLERARQWFPHLEIEGEPRFWCGLRPATPSNLPYIGRTRYTNLWLNTGHGTLGWTMSCGSAAALADLVDGRRPAPEFPSCDADRHPLPPRCGRVRRRSRGSACGGAGRRGRAHRRAGRRGGRLRADQNHGRVIPGCVAAYGIHPLYVMRAAEADLAVLRDWLAGERPVAVGEIGLDFFVADLDPARQEHFFVEQLKLAREFDLPVLLHVRRSVDAVLKQLRRHRVRGGIAHAFNGSRQQADAFIGLGFKLGFGGTLTYPGSTRIRALAAELPLDAIVLETDAPDIPPAWLAAAQCAGRVARHRRGARRIAALRLRDRRGDQHNACAVLACSFLLFYLPNQSQR
jgi:Tat protein secretion system quality control protein TatD with DNase activity